MTLKERINSLVQLGIYLKTKDERIEAVIHKTHFHNQWFTVENVELALQAIIEQFLNKEKLEGWTVNYPALKESKKSIKVGMVMAGNIPLVGFHDVLCCFVAGHKSIVKLSSKDEFLLPFLTDYMITQDTQVSDYFDYVERLNGMEAVIATGSNNAANHFETYFAKYPNIIRRNRNGVAVFDGNETKEEMVSFGKDVFSFFGLGCRNVSKIYIPSDFDVKILIEVMHDYYKELVLHHKYKNNYDYNYTIYLMNKDPFLMSGSLIWREDPTLMSRIACIHYEKYDNKSKLEEHLNDIQDQIQCVITNSDINGFDTISFGQGQLPALDDYADGVDTMIFLTGLS